MSEIERLVAEITKLKLTVKDLEKRLDESEDSLAVSESYIETLEARFGIVHDDDF